MILKIEVPEKGCVGCPHFKTNEIDHNYYGETSISHECMIFGKKLDGCNKCGDCLACLEESEEDVRKYADFLVREINKMAEETYENAINDFANLIKPNVNKPEVIDQMVEELKKRALSNDHSN